MAGLAHCGDGYVWRKYGEKIVGASHNALTRSYFRCTALDCPAKKRVDRLVDDAPTAQPLAVFITTQHNHAPKPEAHHENLPLPATCPDDLTSPVEAQVKEKAETQTPFPRKKARQRGVWDEVRPEDIASAMFHDLNHQLQKVSPAERAEFAVVPGKITAPGAPEPVPSLWSPGRKSSASLLPQVAASASRSQLWSDQGHGVHVESLSSLPVQDQVSISTSNHGAVSHALQQHQLVAEEASSTFMLQKSPRMILSTPALHDTSNRSLAASTYHENVDNSHHDGVVKPPIMGTILRQLMAAHTEGHTGTFYTRSTVAALLHILTQGASLEATRTASGRSSVGASASPRPRVEAAHESTDGVSGTTGGTRGSNSPLEGRVLMGSRSPLDGNSPGMSVAGYWDALSSGAALAGMQGQQSVFCPLSNKAGSKPASGKQPMATGHLASAKHLPRTKLHNPMPFHSQASHDYDGRCIGGSGAELAPLPPAIKRRKQIGSRQTSHHEGPCWSKDALDHNSSVVD